MDKRRYSEDEKANALAALAANGGNVQKTAKQLGMPEPTLRKWSLGKVHPVVLLKEDERKKDLADRLEEVAHALVDSIPGKIPAAPLQQISVSVGIAVEKMRLLREQSTDIVEDGMTDEERIARLRRLAQRGRARRLGTPDPAGAPGVGQTHAGNGDGKSA